LNVVESLAEPCGRACWHVESVGNEGREVSRGMCVTSGKLRGPRIPVVCE
jgi:hypothetical protein